MFDPNEHPTADWPHALSLESLTQDDGMGEPVETMSSWALYGEQEELFDPFLHFIADTESFYDLP